MRKNGVRGHKGQVNDNEGGKVSSNGERRRRKKLDWIWRNWGRKGEESGGSDVELVIEMSCGQD